MSTNNYTVRFLCTGNSARSIIAECILNRVGRGRFTAYSAGSFPRGEVHRFALELLRRLDFPTELLRSKSWDDFTADAPPLDFVFTVCDKAAGEVLPGLARTAPERAFGGLPDPAAVEGNDAEKRLAFAEALRMLSNRVGAFVNLPVRSLDRLSLQTRLDEIGRDLPASA